MQATSGLYSRGIHILNCFHAWSLCSIWWFYLLSSAPVQPRAWHRPMTLLSRPEPGREIAFLWRPFIMSLALLRLGPAFSFRVSVCRQLVELATLNIGCIKCTDAMRTFLSSSHVKSKRTICVVRSRRKKHAPRSRLTHVAHRKSRIQSIWKTNGCEMRSCYAVGHRSYISLCITYCHISFCVPRSS